MVALWSQILGTRVSEGDTFLAMGGDSVQAMRLLLACSSEFGIEFSLQLLADLFRHDVREFTRVILAFTSCGGN